MFGLKIYTVHIKPDMANANAKPVFIKEGFNLWGFFFTILWTLYNRLWLASVFLVLYNALLFSLLKSHTLNLPSALVLHLALHIIVGCWGNDWRRAKLARRGYVLADITASDSKLRAQQRYFERMLAA